MEADDGSRLLVMEGISKRFPGVVALDRVNFTVRAGEIAALMGENGAGKSTLLKVLTGAYRPDEGRIRLDGRGIDPRSPHDAASRGISAVHQEVNLIPRLSVAENILLGRLPLRWGRIDWRSVRSRAEAAMNRLDVSIDVMRPLDTFSPAIQQMTAIARSLDVTCRLLILDEPTSSLDTDEVERLFDVLRRLKAEGLGIVFVTHFLDQVYRIADRITILRNGRLVDECTASSLPRIDLVAKMVGRETAEIEAMEAERRRDRILSRERAGTPKHRESFVRTVGLAKSGAIEPIDLAFPPGEVVGLAGLLGSGRTETARLLFGIDRPDRGEIHVEGKPAAISSPREAVTRRFAFLPEDRKVEGIVPDLSVRENIILALQSRRGILRRLSGGTQREIAERYIRALGIATPDSEKPIRDLSGGNQQKAVLARWLASDPRFLILDEPMRGIDVGAKGEIERLIRALAAEGKAILFISSELDETTRAADRVAVLRDRVKVAELEGEEITEAIILRAIAGTTDSTGGNASPEMHLAASDASESPEGM